MGDRYFALLPENEIGAALEERVRNHFTRGAETGRFSKILKSHALSIGAAVNDSGAVSWKLTRGGEQGELVYSQENHYRSLGNSVLNLTTAERPTIQCNAANSDSSSIGQSLLADGLVDYYLTKRGVEILLKRACKRGIYQSEGFVYVPWDAAAGEPYMPILDEETGETTGATKTGDVAFYCLGPLDVARDEWAESFEQLNWLMARTWRSKHDLAARYPELAEKIEGLEADEDSRQQRIGMGSRSEDTDLIPCWDFFHKKTDAVPDGRMVTFLSGEIVLFDGPLPYSEIPVYRVCPDELDGTPFGDTPMFDLMGPQDAVNGIDTATITDQLGRGIGNFLQDDDADLSVEQIRGHFNAIKKKKGSEVSAFEFPAVPADLFQSKKDKIAAMETLSGVNSVTRGNPSENVGADASGAKAALIDAKSIQNNSGLEKSYVGLVRDVCLAILNRFRDFGGDVRRIAKIAGKNNQALVREFVGGELGDIEIKVEMGNPVLRTTSGKITVADKAVQLGVIKPGQLDKYLMLLRTGQEGPLYEVETGIQMRIRGENESLLSGEGEPHSASIADPHWREIPEHLSLLDNKAARGKSPEAEELRIRVLAATQEHIDLLLQMPPWMVMMRGGPEAMAIYKQVQAMMVPPPVPGQPSPTAPPAPGASSGTQPPQSGVESTTNPEGSKPEQPGMPRMAVQPGGEPAVNLGGEVLQ